MEQATRVELAEWWEENAAARVPILNDPQVYRFLAPDLPLPYTQECSREYLHTCQAAGAYEYAVVADGTIVGGIGGGMGADNAGGTVFELGYYLAASHWRRGIMSRAIPLFLSLLREAEPGLVCVRARVYDFNTASCALLRHCGFVCRPGGELLRARDGLLHELFLYERTLHGERPL